MILTDEWTRELAKHENIVKDLEQKYQEKCEALKVGLLLQVLNKNAIKQINVKLSISTLQSTNNVRNR